MEARKTNEKKHDSYKICKMWVFSYCYLMIPALSSLLCWVLCHHLEVLGRKRWSSQYSISHCRVCRIASLWKICYQHKNNVNICSAECFDKSFGMLLSWSWTCKHDFSYTDLEKNWSFLVLPHICRSWRFRIKWNFWCYIRMVFKANSRHTQWIKNTSCANKVGDIRMAKLLYN